MNKLQAYCDLVASRKTCSLCCGLTNPGTIECRQFDSDQIGPWSRWQGCLDTEVLVVGQDWGDIDFFLKGQGLDPDKNPTNDNLRELLASIGFHIGRPGEAQEQVLFFTNLILCLKKGGLQAPVQPV